MNLTVRNIVILSILLAAAGLGVMEYFGLRDDYNALFAEGGVQRISNAERAELLVSNISSVAAENDHEKVILLIEELREIQPSIPTELTFIEGRALIETADHKAGKSRLDEYIQKVGREGAHYGEALDLLAKADLGLAQEQELIEFDKTVAGLKLDIREGRTDAALEKIIFIKESDVPLPANFSYYEGILLAINGKRDDATSVLEAYVTSGDPQDVYVQKADALLGDLGGKTLASIAADKERAAQEATEKARQEELAEQRRIEQAALAKKRAEEEAVRQAELEAKRKEAARYTNATNCIELNVRRVDDGSSYEIKNFCGKPVFVSYCLNSVRYNPDSTAFPADQIPFCSKGYRKLTVAAGRTIQFHGVDLSGATLAGGDKFDITLAQCEYNYPLHEAGTKYKCPSLTY